MQSIMGKRPQKVTLRHHPVLTARQKTHEWWETRWEAFSFQSDTWFKFHLSNSRARHPSLLRQAGPATPACIIFLINNAQLFPTGWVIPPRTSTLTFLLTHNEYLHRNLWSYLNLMNNIVLSGLRRPGWRRGSRGVARWCVSLERSLGTTPRIRMHERKRALGGYAAQCNTTISQFSIKTRKPAASSQTATTPPRWEDVSESYRASFLFFFFTPWGWPAPVWCQTRFTKFPLAWIRYYYLREALKLLCDDHEK